MQQQNTTFPPRCDVDGRRVAVGRAGFVSIYTLRWSNRLGMWVVCWRGKRKVQVMHSMLLPLRPLCAKRTAFYESSLNCFARLETSDIAQSFMKFRSQFEFLRDKSILCGITTIQIEALLTSHHNCSI